MTSTGSTGSVATPARPPSSGPPRGPGGEPPPRAAETRTGLAGLFALPGLAVRAVVRSAAATPGRLTVIAVGLVLLALITGIIGAISVQGKKDTINELIDHREPLAVAAQQVYRSLSDADATAASAFLATGTEPPALRSRYELDVAQAGSALAKAASDAGGVPEAAAQVDVINQQFPVYTGLIETARANNRQGFPAGASYLREASELMRTKILPAAADLYRIDTERLMTEQDDATDVPWVAGVLVLALLGSLIATQVYLKRRTNRVLNVGLLVATGAVVLALLWSAVALVVQGIAVGSGSENGTRQVDLAVQARISAQQARADETLTLVARGDGAKYEKEFTELTTKMVGQDGKGGLLGELRSLAADAGNTEQVDRAITEAGVWLQAHRKVRENDDVGKYAEAVSLAIDERQAEGSTGAFLRMDESLVEVIKDGRQEFLDETSFADGALTLLAPGVAVLAVIAAAGATMGIRERLMEYR
ncbi:hypothetical protein [Amycolatopsis sp. YIM 10]|uniref:hypothetical protein n=1 Tax=Amycolatopsis sp. YIM 10 TaxID=2653857 RepID=UPI0012A868AF|nr:hypothetical protein [Amycolatopsis sp. YIM 10]QFU94299.1 hypothetical protein YIM_45860 [Amycolatopsis sp. YIM 10]